MRSAGYCVLVALLMSAPCFAQHKVALEINHVGNDPAGQALVADLRELFRDYVSPAIPSRDGAAVERYGIRLTSGVSRPRIRLQVLTREVKPGPYTAIVINVTYDSADMPLAGGLVGGMFETCARNEGAACAKRILLKTGTALDWLRESWPSLWKTL
jgi:hypothetical protein